MQYQRRKTRGSARTVIIFGKSGFRGKNGHFGRFQAKTGLL
jgi:hypothetical protein